MVITYVSKIKYSKNWGMLCSTRCPVSQTTFPVFAAEQTGLKASQDNVNIPDSTFKAYLNGLLGQSSTANITEAQMDSLTYITLANINVTDLTGIEYAHNIKDLTINNIHATNYNPISGLSNLERLRIMEQMLLPIKFQI